MDVIKVVLIDILNAKLVWMQEVIKSINIVMWGTYILATYTMEHKNTEKNMLKTYLENDIFILSNLTKK